MLRFESLCRKLLAKYCKSAQSATQPSSPGATSPGPSPNSRDRKLFEFCRCSGRGCPLLSLKSEGAPGHCVMGSFLLWLRGRLRAACQCQSPLVPVEQVCYLMSFPRLNCFMCVVSQKSPQVPSFFSYLHLSFLLSFLLLNICVQYNISL